jgi:hypothetical protein
VTARYLDPWRFDVDIRPTVRRPIPGSIATLVRAMAAAL